MKDQTLTLGQLRQLFHLFSCPLWRTSIIEITANATAFTLDSTPYVIDPNYINKLTKEGTYEQKEAVEKLGINLTNDKNAFIASFDRKFLSDVSSKMLGKMLSMQIGDQAPISINRKDLQGRSLWFSKEIEIILHYPLSGGTLIELKKR